MTRTENKTPTQRTKKPLKLPKTGLTLTLIVMAIGIFLLSLSYGQVSIPFRDIVQIMLYQATNGQLGQVDSLSQATINIIWFVRLPRVVMALIVGIGLAVSGAVMQAVVQNPLADPYILGISSGASLGATFAIMIGFGAVGVFAQIGLAMSAFLGALAATFLVLIIANVGGQMTATKLILAGTIINSLLGSLSSLIIYLANNTEGMRSVTFWMMGSLGSASFQKLPLMASLTVVIVLFFGMQFQILNVMLLGDDAAISLGISLTRYRQLYMVVASLLTAVIVANSGMIGFVGLIIPHIVRGLYGSDHRVLIPMTAFLGGTFLMVADLLSRILLESVELPIGILTAIIGAPVLIYIIVIRNYRFGGV